MNSKRVGLAMAMVMGGAFMVAGCGPGEDSAEGMSDMERAAAGLAGQDSAPSTGAPGPQVGRVSSSDVRSEFGGGTQTASRTSGGSPSARSNASSSVQAGRISSAILGRTDPATGKFTVPGQFTIDSPGGGFAWEHLTTEIISGTNFHVYRCQDDPPRSSLVLGLHEFVLEGEDQRREAIKAHYNRLLENMKRRLPGVRGQPPSIASPIPDRVTYTAQFTAQDGSTAQVHGMTVFGRNLYSFISAGIDSKEAETLRKVMESFQEL